ncbi:hypothetical protein FN846DRAFT_774049 [Sphaerosporella brunnea]|uniref:Uncharacterized protein n=1 Tax=Sphaerosporella brunnea TaxID=1250544 RepID=A0A5J5F4Z2_9PEZI|nr:hypothetical protein FN846DRAFT_774049 [Sphaerosporella brunnea]
MEAPESASTASVIADSRSAPAKGTRPYPRHHAVLKHLPTLPRELIHQVLDDLGVGTILELICSNDVPWLDNAVSSHLVLGKIFPADKLLVLKAWLKIYFEMRGTRRGYEGLHSRFQHRSISYSEILTDVQYRVQLELKKYVPFIPDLEDYVPEPGQILEPVTASMAFPEVEKLWNTLDAAEAKLNATKAHQLQEIVRLSRIYPGWLRDSKDPTKEKHQNEEHRIKRYEAVAEKITKRQILGKTWVGAYWFESGRCPVMPYDCLLRLFLKTLERFPPAAEAAPVLMRTLYAENFGSNKGLKQPMFLTSDSKRLPHEQRTLPIPLDERELQWLDGFLRSCRFMAEWDEEWKKGLTVAEYWKVHNGQFLGKDLV